MPGHLRTVKISDARGPEKHRQVSRLQRLQGIGHQPVPCHRDLFCLEVWFGLFLEHFDINHFWVVSERGGFHEQPKKVPRSAPADPPTWPRYGYAAPRQPW